MKDPLQIEQNAYDILEIPETADKAIIDAGFKNVIGRKGQIAQENRRTLHDILDRSLTDMLLYRNDYLNQLGISETDQDQLRHNRPAIFRKWSDLNKKNFPEIGPQTFCLSVLLYWWAINEEEYYWSMKSGSKNRESITGSPGIDVLWQQNIAYWVSIINSEHAVLAWLNNKNYYNVTFSANKAKEICQKLKSHFSMIFDKYIQRSQEAGDKDRADMYRSLELSFNTDLDTASKIREIGFKKEVNGRSYPIYCGKLMLQEVEQLSYIRSQLDNLKQAYIKDDRIKKIIDNVGISLSEYHYITLMIKNKDYDGALRAIEGLSIFERSREEVINIHATALFEKGKNLMESDMTDEAIVIWKEVQKIDKLSDEYSASIAQTCKTKAADLLQRNPESAVKLIQDCQALAKQDTELEQLLALAYSRLGMKKLEKATRDFEKDQNRDKLKKALLSAIADLEKSVQLNPRDANTVENLNLARSYINTLNAPVVPPVNNTTESLRLNDEGIKLLKEAEEYSKSGQSQMAMFTALSAVGSFTKANELNPMDSVIAKNVTIARGWLDKYTRENNTKQNRGSARKSQSSGATVFFILAVIALVLLMVLDKKII
jgi:hypothetical protein